MSSSEKFKMNDGDWICSDSQCGNVNFARRSTCNRCGKGGEKLSTSAKEKAAAAARKKLGHEIGKAAAEKSRGLFSADDWQCGRCGNVNWARRQTCNMCNAPKFGEVEERTGLGGGYNERENVEYKEREDSDGEYDEFGRKKKKDKVKEKTVPKYDKVEEEVEDDEEDDDEDGDLSKYDLTGWGDDDDEEEEKETKQTENDKPKTAKSSSRSRSSSRSSSRSKSRSSSSSSKSSQSSSDSEQAKSNDKRRNSRSRSNSPNSKKKRVEKDSSSSRSPSASRTRSISGSPVQKKK